MALGDALSELIDHRGKTPKKLGGGWSLTGHRVVSALNLKDHRVDENDHHYVNDELYKRWMKVPLRRGDVLLTSEAPLGQVAYLSADFDWCLGQRVFGLRANPKILDARFLFYLLRGGPVREQLFARSTGSTVSGIRQSELVKIRLALPALPEQRRVAAALGSLDDKIESNRRARQLAWDVLSAEYNRIASSGRPARLGDILRLEYGKALPAANRLAGEVPVFGSNGMTGNHNVPLIGGPAVIVGRKGTIGLVHWSHVPCFPIDTTFYVVPDPEYPLLAAYFALQSAGLPNMNSDSAVPGLNRDAALQVEVVVPANDDARTWAESRQQLLAQIRHFEDESAILSALRDVSLPLLVARHSDLPRAVDEVSA